MFKISNTVLLTVFAVIILFLFVGCGDDDNNPAGSKTPPIVTDNDGNAYKMVQVGTQWWMAENLRVTRYRNGDSIPNVTGNADWVGLTGGAYCEYDNDSANAIIYGRLYNWYAINDPRNIAPDGWHVPSDSEWQVLIDFLGSDSVAGGKMKDTGTGYWIGPNIGATNEIGFTALPGGFREDSYYSMNNYAAFWTSTEADSSNAWYHYLGSHVTNIRRSEYDKYVGLSVRCVKD